MKNIYFGSEIFSLAVMTIIIWSFSLVNFKVWKTKYNGFSLAVYEFSDMRPSKHELCFVFSYPSFFLNM